MGLFNWGKKKKEEEPLEVGFQGGELHINPPADVSLARAEGRAKRIRIWLDSPKAKDNPEKAEKMKKTVLTDRDLFRQRE